MGNFFDAMLQNVNNVLNSFVSKFSSAIISEISGVVYAGLILYFLWLGISYLRGQSDEPILDTGWHMIKVGVIVSIALNVGTYQDWIVNSVLDLPDKMVSSVMASAMGGVHTGDGLAQLLDNTFFKGIEVANKYFENGKIGLTEMDLMPYLNGVLVIAGTIFCLIIAAFWLFATKIILSLLLGVGPIFIVALIWNPTKHFFGTWLGTVLSVIFINLFIMGTFAIFITIFDSYLGSMNPAATEANHLADTVVVLFMGIITCGILILLPTFVAQLTGGSMAIGQAWTAIKAAGAGTAGAVGGAALAAERGAQSLGNGARGAANMGSMAYGGMQTYNEGRNAGMNRAASFNRAVNKVSELYKK
ncbi:type IV secretion system protein [Acinetobacter pittii]|uniref:type IV secretion system protein n=1 Tax=Acinetobacter pittii TaxID=48296 RepID=UPI00326164A9